MNSAIILSVAECKAIRVLSEAMKLALWSPVPIEEQADGTYDLMAVKYKLDGENGAYVIRNVELDDYIQVGLRDQMKMACVVRNLLIDHPELHLLSASQRGFDRFTAFTSDDEETMLIDLDPDPPFEIAFRPRDDNDE